MFERRTHIRVPAGIEGRYQQLGTLAAPHLGITQDIGLGGMRFTSTERLQPGENVSVDLSLPDEGEVGIQGIVLWSREAAGLSGGFESGLRWTDLGPAAQARLNAFLTRRTRAPEVPLISGGVVPSRIIDWPRAIALGLLLSLLSLLAAKSWVDWYALRVENRSLNFAVESYQDQIKKQFPPY